MAKSKLVTYFGPDVGDFTSIQCVVLDFICQISLVEQVTVYEINRDGRSHCTDLEVIVVGENRPISVIQFEGDMLSIKSFSCDSQRDITGTVTSRIELSNPTSLQQLRECIMKFGAGHPRA